MAADLCIHVLDGATEADVRDFFAGGNWDEATKSWGAAHSRVSKTPSVWVGEVSYLRAALTGDAGSSVPTVVLRVGQVIGDHLPVIDEEMIERVAEAWALPPNAAQAVGGYKVAERDKVLGFLRQHAGKRAFTVAW